MAEYCVRCGAWLNGSSTSHSPSCPGFINNNFARNDIVNIDISPGITPVISPILPDPLLPNRKELPPLKDLFTQDKILPRDIFPKKFP
jgi:hypothetical protein